MCTWKSVEIIGETRARLRSRIGRASSWKNGVQKRGEKLLLLMLGGSNGAAAKIEAIVGAAQYRAILTYTRVYTLCRRISQSGERKERRPGEARACSSISHLRVIDVRRARAQIPPPTPIPCRPHPGAGCIPPLSAHATYTSATVYVRCAVLCSLLLLSAQGLPLFCRDYEWAKECRDCPLDDGRYAKSLAGSFGPELFFKLLFLYVQCINCKKIHLNVIWTFYVTFHEHCIWYEYLHNSTSRTRS